MKRPGPDPRVTLGIASVERETGLSKDTLRVWERRYGFPAPVRDEHGERAYPADQVERLRIIRRLLDAGHRAGGVVALPMNQLRRLAEGAGTAGAGGGARGAAAPLPDDLAAFVDLVKSHDMRALRNGFTEAVRRLGLGAFVTEVAAPLSMHVGDCWSRGTVEVYEEHLFTDALRSVLRNAIDSAPRAESRPAVLLTTLPGEAHGLGLLMAEAMLALEGCRCQSLGVQTPLWDVVLAASAMRADIVALSFSAAANPNFVREGLAELRSTLPRPAEIWAGGRSAALQRRPPADIVIETELTGVSAQVARWRERHPRA